MLQGYQITDFCSGNQNTQYSSREIKHTEFLRGNKITQYSSGSIKTNAILEGKVFTNSWTTVVILTIF
jgi:hypothetical protein